MRAESEPLWADQSRPAAAAAALCTRPRPNILFFLPLTGKTFLCLVSRRKKDAARNQGVARGRIMETTSSVG